MHTVLDAISRVSILVIWSEIGYGVSTLVLNWVCFLEEASFSSSSVIKTVNKIHS